MTRPARRRPPIDGDESVADWLPLVALSVFAVLALWAVRRGGGT